MTWINWILDYPICAFIMGVLSVYLYLGIMNSLKPKQNSDIIKGPIETNKDEEKGEK